MNTKQIMGSKDEVNYALSFGTCPDKVNYNDVSIKSFTVGQVKSYSHEKTGAFSALKSFHGALNQKKVANLKAQSTTSGGPGTAGYALVPVYVDDKIVDYSRQQTPAVAMTPRVTNKGMTADYNVILSKGGAFTAAEGASLTARDNVYDRKSTSIKLLYAKGKVTGPSLAAQPGYLLMGVGHNDSNPIGGFQDIMAANSKQQEILLHARAMKELEEDLFFNGNSTTSGITGNPNGTEFDGIVTLMGATNTVAKSGGVLTLDDIDTAVQNAVSDGGLPNVSFASLSAWTKVKILTQNFQRTNPAVVTSWGFSSINLNTMSGVIPLIPSRYLNDTVDSRAIYFLDMSIVEMRVLMDMMYQEKPDEDDTNVFLLKSYQTLLLRAPQFCSSITGIGVTA